MDFVVITTKMPLHRIESRYRIGIFLPPAVRRRRRRRRPTEGRGSRTAAPARSSQAPVVVDSSPGSRACRRRGSKERGERRVAGEGEQERGAPAGARSRDGGAGGQAKLRRARVLDPPAGGRRRCIRAGAGRRWEDGGCVWTGSSGECWGFREEDQRIRSARGKIRK
jgi:hypothetical protein